MEISVNAIRNDNGATFVDLVVHDGQNTYAHERLTVDAAESLAKMLEAAAHTARRAVQLRGVA